MKGIWVCLLLGFRKQLNTLTSFWLACVKKDTPGYGFCSIWILFQRVQTLVCLTCVGVRYLKYVLGNTQTKAWPFKVC